MILLLKIMLIDCLIIVSLRTTAIIVANKIRQRIFYDEIKSKVKFNFKNRYILKSIIAFVICIISLIHGNGLIRSLICGIITFILIFCYERIQNNSIKKQVLQDLLNVVECLRVQISSGISLDIALRNIQNLCKNRSFSQELANLYLEYQLSKFTVNNSAKELQRKFDYPEIRMFVSAINQQTQSTSALEAFDNLLEVLKDKYIGYMEDVTRSKSVIMIMGVCIVVMNLAAMSVYPLIMEANEALKVMLK